MIGAYKYAGHGVTYVPLVMLVVMFLAVILFVDDTDLLLRAERATMHDGEFLTTIKKALDD